MSEGGQIPDAPTYLYEQRKKEKTAPNNDKPMAIDTKLSNSTKQRKFEGQKGQISDSNRVGLGNFGSDGLLKSKLLVAGMRAGRTFALHTTKLGLSPQTKST